MHRAIREAAQRKGGRKRVVKGIGALSPERRKEITSMGGYAKHANNNSRNGTQQTQVDSSDNMPKLENILGALDEEEL